jgi:hypothetical protein
VDHAPFGRGEDTHRSSPMPRDEYDDRDDDRPRKRRRRDDDDYDRPPPKSNTGLILLIVGLVVGLPILACGGFMVWGFFAAKKGFDQVMVMAGGEMAAQSFLNALEGNNIQSAYDMTSADYKTKKTKADLEQLVKANPVLTSANYHTNTGLPTPTGTSPNRKMVMTYSINPGNDPDGFDPDEGEDDPEFKPKVAKPKAKANPNAKGITCTITLAEQADGQWKVDNFTIP